MRQAFCLDTARGLFGLVGCGTRLGRFVWTRHAVSATGCNTNTIRRIIMTVWLDAARDVHYLVSANRASGCTVALKNTRNTRQLGVKGTRPLAGRGAAPHKKRYKKELQK
jgi:hypothetical protein